MVKSNPMNKGNRIIILADANSNGGVNLLPNGPEFLVAKTPEDPDPPAAPGSWGDVSPKKKRLRALGWMDVSRPKIHGKNDSLKLTVTSLLRT